jgi:hypothetical protein
VFGEERLVVQYDERFFLRGWQISVEMDSEHRGIACQNSSHPEVDEPIVQPQKPTKVELTLVEDGACVTEQEQLIHEPDELLDATERLDVGDAEARDWPPEVSPAPGEHARPHRIPRFDETERVMQQVVREGAEPVFEASRGHFRGLAPARHSVEQVPGVDAAEENKEI